MMLQIESRGRGLGRWVWPHHLAFAGRVEQSGGGPPLAAQPPGALEGHLSPLTLGCGLGNHCSTLAIHSPQQTAVETCSAVTCAAALAFPSNWRRSNKQQRPCAAVVAD